MTLRGHMQIAHFLMCLEKGLPLNVTCRDALQMFARALKEMNPATYVNSFVNAGLLPTGRPAGTAHRPNIGTQCSDLTCSAAS
jgi:hypothetical protein